MMSTKMRMRMKFKCGMALFKWCKFMDIFYTKIGLENMSLRWYKRSCRIFFKITNEYLDYIRYTCK